MVLSGADVPAIPQAELLTREGTVEAARRSTNWIPAEPGLKLAVEDRLRTLAFSRATLRLAELGRLRINELTTLEILPPKTSENRATLDLKAGAVYFFTREKPHEFLLQTPYAIGASRGTEFLAEVDSTGRTLLTVFDGEVELSNARGGIILTNGEQGMVEAGQPPVKTAVIQAQRIVQWWLYYPGVLDPDDLPLTPAEQGNLAASLAAYRAGDLQGALAAWPRAQSPQSDAERLYYAGLVLAVGQLEQSETLLNSLKTSLLPQSIALREVIAVVTSRDPPEARPPRLATEWLALSYVQQPTNLAAALVSARRAVGVDPDFGYAWERVAELEFSFQHIRSAGEALNKALQLSPRNAQALALRGFIFSTENDIHNAELSFEEAIETDPALANGWLGRGLNRIRRGDQEGGLADLQTAAVMEPNRSLLRSYLGKGFQKVFDKTHALRELMLARRLDTNDPTPWLYLALSDAQDNRLNQGVADLEKSVALNDNRRLYRSELLLDQDRAVRSANLARLYQRDGMEEVSFREASAAVNADYANYSAHRFLADSLDALRDPTRFNLRYESSWSHELLLSRLLAPVGAGTLSQDISQQEYSKLFEADGLGVVSDTSWRSDGQFHEVASQYGTYGDSSYALDVDYQHNDGVRTNNALTRLDVRGLLQQQLTMMDSVLFFFNYQNYQSGDNFQYYDPASQLRPHLSFQETENPDLAVGYHREWAPGVHTLFLGSRLHAEQQWSDQNFLVPLLIQAPFGNGLTYVPLNANYYDEQEIYSAELNQIVQTENQILVFGARAQTGQFHATDLLTVPANGLPTNLFLVPPASAVLSYNFQRLTGYGYYTRRFLETVWLTAGLSYDDVTYPKNFFDVPISPGETQKSQLNPKAALVWSPVPQVTVRSAYLKSLGGISIDQDFRLEPVQLAGFNQSYRNIISDSVVSAVPVPSSQLVGAAVDTRFKTGTYFGVQGSILKSDNGRTYNVLGNNGVPPAVPGSTLQQLDYQEQTINASFNQLAGEYWSLGLLFQFSRADLQTSYPQVAGLGAQPNSNVHADLYVTEPYLIFNHPSGFFARAEGPWYSQSNYGYTPAEPGDQFYQVNLFAGYRFPHQQGDLSLGLLNVTGVNYHLNPLNYYTELPRSRVLEVRLRVSF